MWHAAGAAEQLALRCKVAVVDGRKRSRGLAGTEVAAVAWVPTLNYVMYVMRPNYFVCVSCFHCGTILLPVCIPRN
jgi:hypothetical protein